ncbi:hypothetical protein Deipr_0901 [Deinococcus proteolyticus MRP]|uniref:Uncharacterized protein n=1 Tax=Deinococcus proteolyticus (strain ATCC 35074 / DSM 20540 / JCM 6276 / NBRC 101906 / NCIMB 13154 / VKM Ac-1939 / CCM 2703 / MRP) TaxID=693977 RepID=F0RMK7_DEIPM|nr:MULTISPECIES: hypothetical protein [Deinococcus]ADY26057.1 hypothetical protein Deipr_0901 [Deinococcus proteolyticus MRP]MCY1702178.1 hypothetical protein [Deinococcus sp. SL84]
MANRTEQKPAPEEDSAQGGPDLLWQLSTALLLAAGLSLLSPLLGGPTPPLGAVAALLGLRLALQTWRAVQRGERRQLPGLVLTALLLGLLALQAGQGG